MEFLRNNLSEINFFGVNKNFEKLKCKFNNENESHFFVDPKLLPCLHSACLDCISQKIEAKLLNCPLCYQVHEIENVNELMTDEKSIAEIESNADEIVEYIFKQIGKLLV